ncbi:MAG: hypothetical protein KKH04_02250 [Proteobacteria bacterium]|nr:hypothetical protein [Pseudomonadota bacterium]
MSRGHESISTGGRNIIFPSGQPSFPNGFGEKLSIALAYPHRYYTAMSNLGFQIVYRERAWEENFPWDFVDHGINKELLWAEYQRALKEGSSF